MKQAEGKNPEVESNAEASEKQAEGTGIPKLIPMLMRARKKKMIVKKKHSTADMKSVLAPSSPLLSPKQDFLHLPLQENNTIVGLISDTHGVLDHATLSALEARSVSAIIHAGDVGDGRCKSRLSSRQVIDLLANETGKAVIAVAGNVDQEVAELPPWQISIVSGFKILTV